MIKIIQANQNLLHHVFFIRKQVFIKEQKVSEEEEYDNFEDESVHLLALVNDQFVGTCRFRKTKVGTKLERFAVLESFRGMGVGKELIAACLLKLKSEKNIYLHAQVQVIGFYQLFGFEAVGENFLEANIVHTRMNLNKT